MSIFSANWNKKMSKPPPYIFAFTQLSKSLREIEGFFICNHIGVTLITMKTILFV